MSFNEINIILHRVWTKKGFSKESNQNYIQIFFPSTKGWLYLDDVKKDEGPLRMYLKVIILTLEINLNM